MTFINAADDKQPKADAKVDKLEDQLAFKSRFVLVFGEIDDKVAYATCRRLLALSEESEAPITMLISSPGGHVESGDAIFDLIRFVRAPVTPVGSGWRATYIGLGIFSGVTMAALAVLMRPRPPIAVATAAARQTGVVPSTRPFGLSMGHAQTLLCIAGVACCVAMAMPQVHIVAYCSDLGFGAARGAQMLSLMLAAGIVSRLVSGLICDRIGGLRTLLLGSVLQGVALLLFLPFDGLVSLYVISALFGLFQGGIVPSYAIIVREHFPAAEAGARVGTVIMATLFGMALGGWMSGKVFDLTGSYHAAFLNGIGWNLLNLTIAVFLLSRVRALARRGAPAAA
jgi:fucose permease